LCIIIALAVSFIAAFLGGLIFSFLTTSLRANQNVTGLALTIFGMGFANFFGVYLLNGSTYTKAAFSNEVFTTKIPFLSKSLGFISEVFTTKIPFLSKSLGFISKAFFSYGFLVYLAIALAVVLHFILKKTHVGLNLRAVGESPATADAAGINVTKYKYLATCIGAGISGLGGLYYVIDYNSGIWATTGDIEALGWLAVALVIFATWRPLNVIWGSYVFGILYWLYQYLPNLLGIKVPNYAMDLVQMVPYLVTIIVLIAISMRKKKENQPPESLGLSYFREER
jgi:simple sugar transport system permease protein